MILKASLFPKQAEYVRSTAPTALYCGGVGAGKTIADVILAIDLAIRFPGIEILICAPTYGMLRDTIMREFTMRCPSVLLSQFNHGMYPEAIFYPNKGKISTIRFRAFDTPGKPKGITVGTVIVEEVTEVEKKVLEKILERLRQQGMPNYLRMSTNTDSKNHYIYQEYVKPVEEGIVTSADIHYIHTTSWDNFLLPEETKQRFRTWEKTTPGHYMRSVLGLWGDFEDGAIGPFEETDDFSTMYRVAFIDSSFSDKAKSDRTAISIVAFSPQPGRENIYWPIEFTGMSWEKSITDANVITEMLLFLDRFTPVETCLESQLGDSTKVFLDRFREVERTLKLKVKNHWTIFHQTRNKHERIMLNVAGNKDRMRVLKGTSPAFLNPIVSYVKGAQHEDEADSLAGAVNQWRVSKPLAEFIRMVERK